MGFLPARSPPRGFFCRAVARARRGCAGPPRRANIPSATEMRPAPRGVARARTIDLQRQLERIEGIVKDAVAKGAVLRAGGTGASGNGGRHGGAANWEEFTQWQWVTIRDRATPYPF